MDNRSFGEQEAQRADSRTKTSAARRKAIDGRRAKRLADMDSVRSEYNSQAQIKGMRRM